MPRKQRQVYSADFETTTDPNDCRVWACGVMNVYDLNDYTEMNSIEQFFDFMKCNDGDYYFHNLKFDGRFIVDYLLKNGYEYSKKAKDTSFHTVISNTGAWYSINITFKVNKTTTRSCTIYDSLKKLPFPVKRIAEAFKLPILKGSIDYHAFRPIGHILTLEESLYLKNDVEIMARALRIQFDEGHSKMTIGSDSLSAFKETIGGNKGFRNYFPVLPEKLDAKIRQAYRGGYVWANPKTQGKIVGAGKVYDVNSLYPYIMYSKRMPFGVPLRFTGQYKQDDAYPLYIQTIKCDFELKPNHMPTVQIKNSRFFEGNEYLTSSDDEHVTLHMTNDDMDLLFKHYDVYNIEYVDGVKFMSIEGIFNKYIDKWSEVKKNNTGAIRELAKLLLNNLYGKFASNPNVTGKIPVLNGDKVSYVLGEEETKEPVYTAVGVFITAGARHLTISTAQACYERICYCDTDSIHITGTEVPDINIDSKELGAWKHESDFTRANFLRQKTYIEDICYHTVDGVEKECSHAEHTHTHINVKISGMPDEVKKKVTFDNFKVGFTSYGKKVPKTVAGGTVLIDGAFTIK